MPFQIKYIYGTLKASHAIKHNDNRVDVTIIIPYLTFHLLEIKVVYTPNVLLGMATFLFTGHRPCQAMIT